MDSITALMRDARAKGKEEGAQDMMVQNIIRLMKSTGWNLPKAMDALSIPKNQRSKYGKLVKAALAAQASAVADL